MILGEAKVSEAVEDPRDRCSSLEPREMHPYADVRSVREGDVMPRGLARDVVLVGALEERRVAVRCGERQGHLVSLADVRTAEVD